MKNEEAIETLEAIAMVESTFSDEESKKCCEAIDLAVEALKREEACFDEPLTLEQLMEKDGEPVFVKMKTLHELTGWAIVHVDYQMQKIRLWGKLGNWLEYKPGDMEVYAYAPAHIDLDAWDPCYACKSCGNCENSRKATMERVYYSHPCHSCLEFDNFEPVSFCRYCGRPLTEKACAELEKRLRG